MNRSRLRNKLLYALSIVLVSGLVIQPKGNAQLENFLMETEQHWDTYGVGGTCISGSHNLFLGDIDGDGDIEIITGGSAYSLFQNGSTTSREAPLRIWTWDGRNITLEFSQGWPGNINCVFAGDLDGDGQLELLTSGTVRNQTASYSSLRVWSYDGASLTLKSSVEGKYTSAIFVSDLNLDGACEIITIGRFNNASQYGAQICLWELEEKGLELKTSSEWYGSNVASVSSVFAEDLNNDGEIEIVTAGYTNDLKNSSGQLRVWQYDGAELSLKANEEWRLVEEGYAFTIAGGIQGNTKANNLKVGDVDSDGVPEIVTGGFAYDGENVNAQLRIWSWNGSGLLLEKSKEWVSDYLTEIKCVSLSDIDGDSALEIITSGGLGAEGSFANNATNPNQAQLRVWSWDGAALTLKQGHDWYIDEGATAWNVATGDVDSDGVVEIVTVGCSALNNTCDPDMRIWSLNKNTSFPISPSVALGMCAIAALIGAFLLTKKRSRLPSSNEQV
jgi:hypothetical protein